MFGKKKKPLDVISLDSERVQNAVQWIEDFKQMLTDKANEVDEELAPDLAEKSKRYADMLERVYTARKHITKLLSLFETQSS